MIVADDGVGLPAALDTSKTATLGLRLVTSLVDQLEGELVLERQPGTTFRITFHPREAQRESETASRSKDEDCPQEERGANLEKSRSARASS